MEIPIFEVRIMNRLFAAICVVLALCSSAHAKLWTWSYHSEGIGAHGEFTTTDTSYAGDYTITGVTGERNGVAITELQPTGTAIPGNEPYAVDNLVSVSGPQLTANGFGFALADGSYSNPFYNNGYLDFHSVPADPKASTESRIVFSATPVAAPAPQPGQGFVGLAVLTMGALALAFRRERRC
jgi:hypothetical protein